MNRRVSNVKITETKTTQSEIYVAPCIKCGSENIDIGDSGYSSFNIGGGECKKCKHTATSGCGCNVTIRECAAIWNRKNDIDMLVKEQENVVITAQKTIAELLAKKELRQKTK